MVVVEPERVTYVEAAALLGTYISRIQWMVARGWIVPEAGRRPALPRDQVLAAPERLQEERTAAAAARAEQQYRAAPTGPPAPPDEVHQWLRIKDAAQLMGVSRQAVAARARRGRLPSIVDDGGIRWFRKDHLELVMKADQAKGRRPATR
ncbi:hypothetical protein GCM10027425_33660 [Alteromonas gracilis]